MLSFRCIIHLIFAITLKSEIWGLRHRWGHWYLERSALAPGHTACLWLSWDLNSRAWLLLPPCVLTSLQTNCYLQTPLPSGSFSVVAVGGFPSLCPQGHNSSLMSLFDQGQLLLSDGFARSLAWPWRLDFTSKWHLNSTSPPKGSQSHFSGSPFQGLP